MKILVPLFLFSAYVQLRVAKVGLYFDDLLIYRPYSLGTVLQTFYTDLGELLVPLWVPAYRPGTVVAHSIIHALVGFHPGGLLLVRALLVTACMLLIWRMLVGFGIGPWRACAAAMVFGIYPTNYYLLTWNTEMGALSGVLYFAGAVICLLKYLQTGASWRWLVGSCVLWACCLLTKETAVPAVVIFGFCVLLYGKRLSLWQAVSTLAAYGMVLIAFMVMRFWVLGGSWGGQGASPDSYVPIMVYVNNYATFLQYVIFAHAPMTPHGKYGLLHVMMIFPLPLMLLRMLHVLVEQGHAYFTSGEGRSLNALRQRSDRLPTDAKLALTGFTLLVAAGSICCFFPHIRLMYYATLGAAIVYGGFFVWMATTAGLGERRSAPLQGIVVIVLLAGMLYLYTAFVFAPSSDFVRLKRYHDVTTYFSYGETFQQWGMEEHAKWLHQSLVEQGLISRDGRPFYQAIGNTLFQDGLPPDEINRLLTQIAEKPGALNYFR